MIDRAVFALSIFFVSFLAWLASETYPEAFKDYDLNKVIKDYYAKWYNYELTDEQIEDMFNI